MPRPRRTNRRPPPPPPSPSSSADAASTPAPSSNARILVPAERKAPDPAIRPVHPSPAAAPSVPALSPLDAFFLVDQVFEDSPAQSAGLRIGDRVLSFGSVTRRSYTKDAMRAVVANSVGRGIRVDVYRVGEGLKTLTLVPQQWAGQGLLGCHLTDV